MLMEVGRITVEATQALVSLEGKATSWQVSTDETDSHEGTMGVELWEKGSDEDRSELRR